MATKAYGGPVELNGVTYAIRGPLLKQSIADWPEASPDTSKRLRQLRRFLDSWEVHTVQGMLVDRDYYDEFQFVYDSTIETRFQNQLTLPGLWQASGWLAVYHRAAANQHNTDRAVVGGVFFDSEIWALESSQVGAVDGLRTRRFNESTGNWDTVEAIATGAVYYPQDLVVHGAYMFAMADRGATGRYLYRRALGSSTWTAISGTYAALKGAVADDGGTQTDQTTEANEATANDMTLLPATPAVNDAYYFGFTEKSSALRLTVGAGDGTWTITWEYYNGTDWVALPGLSDGTTGFTNVATSLVTWTNPSGWTQTAVKGISAWWIRARVSAYTAKVAAPTGTQGWGAGFPSTQAVKDRGLLLSIGKRLFLATWLNSGGTITMYHSTDNGDSWVKSPDTIGSAYPPTSFVSYANDDGLSVPHLGTAEGVWNFDIDGENPSLVVDLKRDSSEWNCLGMAVWSSLGALCIPLGNDPKGQLLAYRVQGGVRAVEQIGLDLGSGLIASRQGRIVDLRMSGAWLFALVRNDTTYECGIFAYDGYGWHHIYDSNSSSGDWPGTNDPYPYAICFSNVDGTERLHLLFTPNKDQTATEENGDALFMEHPAENPLAVSTFKYEDDGYIDFARHAASLPETDAVWLDATVDADGLDTTVNNDDKIVMQYGKDGEARTVNTLGTFYSDAKTLAYASNAGISSKTLGVRLHFYRGSTNTVSPKSFAWAQSFLKVPTVRHIWRFLVDLEKSAAAELRTAEDVIDDIETVESTVTQVTFSFPHENSGSQLYVKLLPPSPSWEFNLSGESDPFESIERKGTVEVMVAELRA